MILEFPSKYFKDFLDILILPKNTVGMQLIATDCPIYGKRLTGSGNLDTQFPKAYYYVREDYGFHC